MVGCLVNDKFKMIWKIPHTVAMRHYPSIHLDRLKKPRKNSILPYDHSNVRCQFLFHYRYKVMVKHNLNAGIKNILCTQFLTNKDVCEQFVWTPVSIPTQM
jgi:hypothetical protein